MLTLALRDLRMLGGIRCGLLVNRDGRALALVIAMPLIDLETINPLTSKIIGCGVEVHRRLGPGLLESVYQVCLVWELRRGGLTVLENKKVPILYREHRLDAAFTLDCLVDDTVVVEIKAVAELAPVHEAQLVTYLRLTNKPVGLLINFNVPVLKDGIRRKLNPSYNPMDSVSLSL
jgi:GxxExxY protein